jgi:hypothetical protein
VDIKTKFEVGDIINVSGLASPVQVGEIRMKIRLSAGFEERLVIYHLVPQNPLNYAYWLQETDKRLNDSVKLPVSEPLTSGRREGPR